MKHWNEKSLSILTPNVELSMQILTWLWKENESHAAPYAASPQKVKREIR